MKRTIRSARLLAVVGWCALLSLAKIAAVKDWPDGYVVCEDTQSPDGTYGILIPTVETGEDGEASEQVNYLADLKNHRLLGKIKRADYFEHQNHRSLKAVWADDSNWCVVQYDSRFGFDMISILKPKASSFVQTEIGDRIVKVITGASLM